MPSADFNPDNPALRAFIALLMACFPQFEEIHWLGGRAGAHLREAPDLRLLLYAGYDEALPLLLALDRAQDELKPPGLSVYLFVEYYSATWCGLWGGRLIRHEELRQWREGEDFGFVAGAPGHGSGLARRIQQPLDRRAGERRQGERRRLLAQVAADNRRQDRRQPYRQAWQRPERLT